MSNVAKENDETMSIASEDEAQLQYNPSFETVLREDDDDSSVPPPPPPLYGLSLAKLSSSIFRSRSKESKQVATSAGDEEIGENRPVQILPAQDDAKSNIEVDAAEQWIKKFGMNQERNGQRRRNLMCTSVLLILVVLLGLAIGLSRNSNQRTNQSENMLASFPTSAPEEVTPSPAPVNTLPNSTFEPSSFVTDPLTNATEAPTEPCTTVVAPLETCYQPQSEITISFTNCEPLSNDWIGIWRVQDVTNVSSLPEPQVWQWTCGSQACQVPVGQDSLSFASGLRAGTYVAQFLHMEEDRAPYTGAFASSSTFEVAQKCP
jgi:hypothetical protein